MRGQGVKNKQHPTTYLYIATSIHAFIHAHSIMGGGKKK